MLAISHPFGFFDHGTGGKAMPDEVDQRHHDRLQTNGSQQHHGHCHVDHQPGHFLSGPGIEGDIAHEPVGNEEAEASWPHEAAHEADQTEYDTDLFVQWNEQEIVIPRLAAARYLLLLQPVIDARPDTITDAASDVGEDYRK